MSTHTIRFDMDSQSRTATVNFGKSVPGTAGQLFAEYTQRKRPSHANISHITETKLGTYVIQTDQRGDFERAVGDLILAGVYMHGWIRADTEVIETHDEGDRHWSLGGAGLADWALVQQP